MNNSQDPVTYLYDQVSLNPQAWRSSACQFKRVANLVLFQIDQDDKDKRSIVHKPISLESLYPYLMSVALENLLKGILIAQKQPFEKVVSFDQDLVELYNECNRSCGLAPKKVERRMLQVLTHFATWAGRFNLPKKKEDFSNTFSKHGLNLAYGIIITPLLSGKPSEERLSVPSERKKIEVLYQRLLNHLDDSLARSGKPNRFPCG